MLVLMLLWLMAILAVPGCALLLRAWFGSGDWMTFHWPTYLIAWAIVGVVEIVGIVTLTGETISILIVGVWSTIGAVAVGALWWLATRAKQSGR